VQPAEVHEVRGDQPPVIPAADQRLDAGAVLTVKDLITLMIIVSDNTATDVLYRMVGGPAVVTRRMEAMGLKKTQAATNGAGWFAALRAAPST